MKEIKTYRIGDKIPETAKCIGSGVDDKLEKFFYYEVLIREKKQSDASEDPVLDIAENVIEYLNHKTGKKYKAHSKENLKLIRGRVNDGYSQDDFFRVIDNMTSAWLEDNKMSQYLRPSTLFRASKFENYLNHKSGAQAAADAFADLEEFCS